MAQSRCTIANGLHKVLGRFSVPCLLFHGSVAAGQLLSKPERTGLRRQQSHCQQEISNSREIDKRCTVMSARGRAQYSSHLPGEFPTELQVIRGEWSFNPTGLQSPGKRKVPGSNPGRSLGHFYRSVIPHASRSLTFKHLMPLI